MGVTENLGTSELHKQKQGLETKGRSSTSANSIWKCRICGKLEQQ